MDAISNPAFKGLDDDMHLPQSAMATHTEPSSTHYHMGYLCMIALVAALGGLLFGYDWVVIGGARPFFEAYFRLQSDVLIGWANRVFCRLTTGGPT